MTYDLTVNTPWLGGIAELEHVRIHGSSRELWKDTLVPACRHMRVRVALPAVHQVGNARVAALLNCSGQVIRRLASQHDGLSRVN